MGLVWLSSGRAIASDHVCIDILRNAAPLLESLVDRVGYEVVSSSFLRGTSRRPSSGAEATSSRRR
jgi:hypothetical protein